MIKSQSNMRTRLVFSLAFSFFVVALSAQKLELGVWGGISSYSGDFTPSSDAGQFLESVVLAPGGGVFVRFNPHDVISARLGLSLGQISGEDGVTNDYTRRDFNFRSNITELALQLDLNLFRLGDPDRTQFVPYLTGGASLFRFNPEGNIDGNWVELQPLGTEAQGAPGYDNPYELTSYALIMGGGVKFIIRENMTVGFEVAARKTFTDYLDDVSATEVNYLDVLQENGSLAARLSNPNITDPETQPLDYRRGGDYDDWFLFSGIHFSFRFGSARVNSRGIGCPTF
jgi:hypothetical protein